MEIGILEFLLIAGVPVGAFYLGQYLRRKRESPTTPEVQPELERRTRNLPEYARELAVENEKMRKRLENLEAIVTSTAWDKQEAIKFDPTLTDAEQAARMARQLSAKTGGE